MNWKKEADTACKQRELTMLDHEGGWIFVEDKKGNIFPVRELIIHSWVAENQSKNSQSIKNG